MVSPERHKFYMVGFGAGTSRGVTGRLGERDKGSGRDRAGEELKKRGVAVPRIFIDLMGKILKSSGEMLEILCKSLRSRMSENGPDDIEFLFFRKVRLYDIADAIQ